MPRVPVYEPNVGFRPDKQAKITVQASPDAFGAGIGRGLQGVAQGVDQLGDAFAQIKELEDTTRVKERDNALAEWDRNATYGEGGFLTLDGKAAVDGRAKYEADFEAKRKELGQGLVGDAARKYDDVSKARQQQSFQRSIVHSANGRKKWFNDASEARLNTFSEDAVAAYNDPKKVDFNIAAGQAEIRQQAKILGWDNDTLANREKEYISSVRYNAAMRLAADDPVKAKKYFDDHKDQFTGPHQADFDAKIKIPLLNENVKRNAGAFFDQAATSGGDGGSVDGGGAAAVIRKFEGFREDTYWDVNAHRTGYGSDTITRADGSVVRVQQGMRVSRADAERDLNRRINTEFIPKIVKQVGAENWAKMPEPAKAALASVAYNYGSLPFKVASAVMMGDTSTVAAAVESLKGHNNGVNAGRRTQEAAIIRGGAMPAGGSVSAQSGGGSSFGSVEKYLEGISDPDERDMTRKLIYSRMEAQNKAQQAQQEAVQQQAFNLIETQNVSPFDLPPEVTTQIGMEGMSSLMTYYEKRSAGRKPETNEETLYSLQEQYANDPASFAQRNLFEVRNELSDEDWKTVNGWRQTALTDQRKAKEEGMNITSAFSQATTQLEAVGIKTTGEDKDSARIASFNNVLAQRMAEYQQQNNKKPNQMEIQGMINQLLLPIVIQSEKSAWNITKTPWSSTSVTDGFAFEANTIPDGATADLAVTYSDIPTDLRRGIATDLERELGRKPSEEEVVQRYEDAILGRGG